MIEWAFKTGSFREYAYGISRISEIFYLVIFFRNITSEKGLTRKPSQPESSLLRLP